MPGFTCICNEGYTIDETGTKCIGEFSHRIWIISRLKTRSKKFSTLRFHENNWFLRHWWVRKESMCSTIRMQKHWWRLWMRMSTWFHQRKWHLYGCRRMPVSFLPPDGAISITRWCCYTKKYFFLGLKRTNANIFALIPLVPTLVNVQKDSSNIEILVSTVMRYVKLLYNITHILWVMYEYII